MEISSQFVPNHSRMNMAKYLTYSLFFKQIRFRHFSAKSKDHYASLGISPSSTQGEVKTAYYNLSKVYHPDKNLGNVEYAQKFRDISEAYEILGNISSRKLYDKGKYIFR